MAAREFGAHVTGVTLSTEQLAWAQQRLAARAWRERGDLRLQDYRDIAAGEPLRRDLLDRDVRGGGARILADATSTTLRALLKPGGRACIQSIMIRDDLFDRYVRSTDFIQQYIFPGGLLPSRSRVRSAGARAPASSVVDGWPSAPTTPRRCAAGASASWRANEPCARSASMKRFMRIWEFYLAYCEAAFASGNTDVVQFTLRRD